MSDDGKNRIPRELSFTSPDPGDFVTRKVQKLGRVDVPDDFWTSLDLSPGDEIVVVMKPDRVVVMEKDSKKLGEVVD